jgi:hypothetical protein
VDSEQLNSAPAVVLFVERLAEKLGNSSVPSDLGSEEAFETHFVVPVIIDTATEFPGLRVLTHPFLNKEVCRPGCDTPEEGGVVQGCPRCWKESKSWGTVSAFGMRHTFDVVGRDANGKTLAIEIKWIGFRGKRAPNGEFQRFLGQCGIAASHHDAVLGVCGLRGGDGTKFDEQREKLVTAFRAAGVTLAMIRVPRLAASPPPP